MPRLPKGLNDAYHDLKRYAHSGASLEQLQQTVGVRVAEALGADALALMYTDPVTFLGTGAFVLGFNPKETDFFFRHIYLQKETWSFLDMKATGEEFSLLSQYTGGDLGKEVRYREFYHPHHLKHEVRVCLTTGDSYWGGLCIMRGGDHRDFTPGEQLFLTQLAPHIGEGLRAASARKALEQGEAGAMTSLWVDADNRILMGSSRADEILAAFRLPEMDQPGYLPGQLQSVTALLAAWRSAGSGVTQSKVEPRLTLQDRAGRWWTVTALEPMAGSPAEIAAVVMITPATPEERFARLMAAFELTPREREMVEMIAAGHSTKEIAGHLFVTSYTVQDHFKKIFEKLGISSRRELMALLFQVRPSAAPGGTGSGRTS